MSKEKSWKEFLLKSGVPLEYEVKQTLKSLGFFTSSETSYLRSDENNIVNEFSYDIDATKRIENHSFQLMIECKYRDSSTNWIFLPEELNESDRGTGSTSFLNTNDFFYKEAYSDYFKLFNLNTNFPFCSKGIEVCSSGPNPKSITQAIAQLSYGIVDKVIFGMKEQLSSREQFICHHIPIIVTTASLYRLKKNVTVNDIKQSSSLDSIAHKESILLIEPTVGEELKEFWLNKYNSFLRRIQLKKENLISLGKKVTKGDVKNYINEISLYPQGILIIQHSEDNLGFLKLLNVLTEIAEPSEETLLWIKKGVEEQKKILREAKENNASI